MAIFYVLPPRAILVDALAKFFRSLLPAIAIPEDRCADLFSTLIQQPNVYLVHREDLPENVDITEALQDGFGAELGDQIIQISLGARWDEPVIRTWQVEETSPAHSLIGSL